MECADELMLLPSTFMAFFKLLIIFNISLDNLTLNPIVFHSPYNVYFLDLIYLYLCIQVILFHKMCRNFSYINAVLCYSLFSILN